MKPSIFDEIMIELRRMKAITPSWPDHPAAQAGRVADKAGTLMRRSLSWKYERESSHAGQVSQILAIRRAAVQAAAEAIRFLEHLKQPSNGRQIIYVQQPDGTNRIQEDSAGEDSGREAGLYPAESGQPAVEADNSGCGQGGLVLQDADGEDPAEGSPVQEQDGQEIS